jgi:low affinity Fe/Cu permease
LGGEFFGLSNNWSFAINFSISVLTLFILWRILRKQKREAKAIRMKIDELSQSIKDAQYEKSGQNGNGSRTGEVKLHR